MFRVGVYRGNVGVMCVELPGSVWRLFLCLVRQERQQWLPNKPSVGLHWIWGLQLNILVNLNSLNTLNANGRPGPLPAMPFQSCRHGDLPTLAVCRLLTVRGRTGAVLAIQGIKSEAGYHIAEVLQARMTEEQRSQTIHVASDSPGLALFLRTLQKGLPRLQSLSLDATHTCICTSSATATRTRMGANGCGSLWLSLRPLTLSLPWQRGARPTLAAPANSLRNTQVKQMMVEQEMTREECSGILTRMSPTTPWYTVVEFLEAVAAVSAVYSEEMNRANGQGTTLGKLLQNLRQPNVIRVQKSVGQTRQRAKNRPSAKHPGPPVPKKEKLPRTPFTLGVLVASLGVLVA